MRTSNPHLFHVVEEMNQRNMEIAKEKESPFAEKLVLEVSRSKS